MRKSFYYSVMTIMALTGCAIGPDYKAPALDVPAAFTHQKSENNVSLADEWWRGFGDENLSTMVENGLTKNFDLQISQAQIDLFLGQFDQAKSYLYPHINATSSFDRKNVENSTIQNQPNGLRSTFSASLALASYEIDLFGKVRRATEAAKAQLAASQYNKRTMTLSVASAISASYIRLVSLQDQIRWSLESEKVAQALVSLTQLKYDKGSVTQTDLYAAKAQVEVAKANTISLRNALVAETATLQTLMGNSYALLEDRLSLSTLTLPSVPVGLPSTILTNRPDVQASEQALISANAQIGVAYGAYFPSLSLTGMLGVQTKDLGDLLKSPARLWQMTPALSLPLLTAGYAEGQIKAAEAQRDQALAQYKKVVLTALNETDSALGQYALLKEQYASAQERARLMEESFHQAQLRYTKGVISYIDLLTIQQTWIAAATQETMTRQSALIGAVNLYKALGGGWSKTPLQGLPSLLPAGR